MHSRCYRPKTIVEYDRKAFIAKENEIRITFDSRIVSVELLRPLFAAAEHEPRARSVLRGA